MIIQIFDKILEATSNLIVLIFKVTVVFIVLNVITYPDDDWIFIEFFTSIFLVFLIKKIFKPRPKKLDIKKFMPGKPERDGIRYLRGKRAKEYDAAWEKTNTYLEVGNFRKFFYGIRLYFYKLTGLKITYFIQRPWYNLVSRRALDIFCITIFEHPERVDNDRTYSFYEKMRFIFLKFKYRKDFKRKEYWIRFWGKNRRLMYFWHEDVEKFEKLYWKPKKTSKSN